mgnify:FL=1
MVTYNNIKDIVNIKTPFKISIKSNYLVLSIPKISEYHITVYENQWDYYSDFTDFEYYLFHISSNSTENRCSTYYWVKTSGLNIVDIPSNYFRYEQETYDMFSSTRKKCNKNESIFLLLSMFEHALKQLKKYLKSRKKHYKYTKILEA